MMGRWQQEGQSECVCLWVSGSVVDMQLLNNSAEPSSPPRIPLHYLGLLGDADSHVPVGLSGPPCRLAVPETVITLQVSNLGTETHAGHHLNQHPSAPAAALQLPPRAAAKLWSRRPSVLFNVET